MDAARWERIESLFNKAVELPEAERSSFLVQACGSDTSLIREVSSMLRADQTGASILDGGLPELAYRTVGGDTESVSLRMVGPYQLLHILGEGGMGVVWLAKRSDTGNLVAIKFLPHAELSPARRERFAREIKTLAKLNHAYIARLYDAGTLPDGTPWFVMEYVEGLPFAEYCRTGAPSIEESLRLLRKICEAVQYAHGQEIIHRDLKPSNILVEPDGTPRLLDFGIARELQGLEGEGEKTRAGLRFLSPDYSAPEWVADGVIGFFTDVYSLGVIAYEVMAGQLPLKTEGNRPRNPSVAGRQRFPHVGQSAWTDLDVLCLTAMHPDHRARYQSVEALIRDIDHFLHGQPLESRADTISYRFSKFVRRNRKTVIASTLAVAGVIGLIAVFTLRLAVERDRANRETAITTAMNRFLADDVLGRSDPLQSGRAQEPFAGVVARSAGQIDAKFADEPVVAARLHHTLARAFDNRSEYRQARGEYDKSYNLFLRGEGSQSEDAVEVNLERAAMEAKSYEAGSMARARALLASADKSIATIARPNPRLIVSALASRGMVALVANDPKAASGLLSAALQRSLQVPGFDDGERLTMKRWLVSAYIHMNDGAKAEPLARELVAALTPRQGPESPSVLWARAYLAQSLFVQRRFAAARDEVNAIYPLLVSVLGEDHQVTMTALGTRAASEGSLMQWDDAIRDDLTIYKVAAGRGGPPSMYTVGMLSDAGLSECRSGRQREGEGHTRKAYLESREAFGANAGLTGGAAYALAVCLTNRNALNEASTLLNDIDAKAVVQLSGDSAAAADIALAKAEVAFRKKDYQTGNRLLDEAAPELDRPDGDVWQRQAYQKVRRTYGGR